MAERAKLQAEFEQTRALVDAMSTQWHRNHDAETESGITHEDNMMSDALSAALDRQTDAGLRVGELRRMIEDLDN